MERAQSLRMLTRTTGSTAAIWITLAMLSGAGLARAEGLTPEQIAIAKRISERADLKRQTRLRAQEWTKTKALLIRLERSAPLKDALKSRGGRIVLAERPGGHEDGVHFTHQIALTPHGLVASQLSTAPSFGFNREVRFLNRADKPATVGSSLWPVKLELSRNKVRLSPSQWGGLKAQDISERVGSWLKEQDAKP